eukprot:SAG11_NODE_37197_length_258_cov_0.641509_1_plen_42_part_01
MLEHWHEEGLLSQPVDEYLYARAAMLTQYSPREAHRFAMRH